MDNKKILLILIVFSLMSIPSLAYPVPTVADAPDCEYHRIKLALVEHDAGNNARWVNDIIEDGEQSNTNSGRSLNNHYQLREWMNKIERLYPKHTNV